MSSQQPEIGGSPGGTTTKRDNERDLGSHSDQGSEGGGFSKTAVRDFIVEFLGGLVPGVALLIGLVPALLIPLIASFLLLVSPVGSSPVGSSPSAIFKNLSAGDAMLLAFPFLIAFLVLSYIAGHLLMRQDPKKADECSFECISNHYGGRVDGMVRPMKSESGGEDVAPVEFPYHFLKNYLEDRDIRYLADLIPWTATSSHEYSKTDDKPATVQDAIFKLFKTVTTIPRLLVNHFRKIGIGFVQNLEHGILRMCHGRIPKQPKDDSTKRRAKHFANALKLRIQMSAPKFYPILARNEAHVRLSSSMWYACRILSSLCIVGFCVYLSVALLKIEPLPLSNRFVLPLLSPIAMFLVCVGTKQAIDRSLHYQREREIIFILEVAHWLKATQGCEKMFDGLTREGFLR